MTTRSVVFLLITLLFLQPVLCGQSKTKSADRKPKERPNQASAAPNNNLPSHYDKAESLVKEGKFAEAIAEYKSSLEDHPENEAAFFGMALAQTQAGLAKEAVLSYEAALKIDPQLWEAETNLGILLMNQQSFDKALPHFHRALELNSKSFQAAFFLAKALEALGRLKEAAEACLQALPLAQDNPQKFEIHASLAAIHFKTGSLEEAEKHLVAARQYGDDPALDLELARLYLQKGEYDKSAELLQPQAGKRPEDSAIQELLGRVWLRKGSLEAAVRALELALQHETDAERRQGISLELAQAYQQLGQPGKAAKLLQAAASGSKDANLHFRLGTLQLQQRNFDPAAQSFLRALQLKPDCVECYSNLGSVFMLQEKYPEAITAFSRFKAARPEAAGTYFYLGIAFDKINDVENALVHYQQFLALDQERSDKQSFQARERMKVLEKRRKKR
ncbi:MAG: tetratricopeptide repeat protein [Acidobacteria bacterium]|nr:tetratricopeptide repeat protein [Acidobacteriota bacterium]MCI0719522.1 tetratricopeptide repeat protein [Acidobacteriota bacterium]